MPDQSRVPMSWKIGAAALAVLVALPLAIAAWTQVGRDLSRCRGVSRWVAAGDKAFKDGDFAAAATLYARARNVDPLDGNAQARAARARVFHFAWHPDTLRNVDLEDLLADARQVESTFPGDKGTSLALQGLVLNLTGRPGEAEDLFKKALAAEPANGAVHFAQALSWRANPEKAKDVQNELKEALKARPQAAEILAMLGKTQLDQGDGTSAVDSFEAALKIREDAQWLGDLGTALLGQGKIEPAIQRLARSTQLNPQNADTWSLLGQALINAKKLEQAEGALRRAMQIQPSAATQLRLATTLNRQNRFRESVGLLQNLAQQNPQDMIILFELGVATEGVGQLENAARVYNAILQLPKPENQQMAGLLQQLQQQAQTRLQNLAQAAPAPAPAPAPAGKQPEKK